MPVESVQCPNCGAAVAIEPGARSGVCGYCGASLRITKGASGHPLAALGSISVDTGILAREAAYRRLEERIGGLLAERAECEKPLETLKAELSDPLERLARLSEEMQQCQLRLQQLDENRRADEDAKRKRRAYWTSKRRQSMTAGGMVLGSWGLCSVLPKVAEVMPPSLGSVFGVAVPVLTWVGFLGVVWILLLREGRPRYSRPLVLYTRESLQRQVALLEAQIRPVQEALHPLLAETERARRRAAELDTEIAGVRAQMSRMKAEIDDLTQEL